MCDVCIGRKEKGGIVDCLVCGTILYRYKWIRQTENNKVLRHFFLHTIIIRFVLPVPTDSLLRYLILRLIRESNQSIII